MCRVSPSLDAYPKSQSTLTSLQHGWDTSRQLLDKDEGQMSHKKIDHGSLGSLKEEKNNDDEPSLDTSIDEGVRASVNFGPNASEKVADPNIFLKEEGKKPEENKLLQRIIKEMKEKRTEEVKFS